MSVKLMTKVYDAHFPDVEFDDNGRKRKVAASSLKSVVLAMADHANDEGEGSYPSLSTLQDKTELTRNTVITALKAARSMSLATFVGRSKLRTSNYTLNKALLEQMATWPSKRKKASEATSPASAASATIAPDVVQPLHQASATTAPEPSFNHPQPSSMGAASAPAASKREPEMDWLKWEQDKAAGAAQRGDALLQDKINDFPEDCRPFLIWFCKRFNLKASAVPGRPGRKQRGGVYAQWINEIRAVYQLLEGTGERGLEAAAKASEHLSISHPGALTWAIPAEVGKLLKRTEERKQARKLTPFQEAMLKRHGENAAQPHA